MELKNFFSFVLSVSLDDGIICGKILLANHCIAMSVSLDGAISCDIILLANIALYANIVLLQCPFLYMATLAAT